MSHPQYRLARRVPAPPDAVLAAIRRSITRTQRRDLPPQLQKGVSGLSGKVRGQRFTVGLDHTGEGGNPTELVGMVVPAEEGGSEVRASVLDSHGAPTLELVLFGIAGFFAVLGIEVFAWTATGFAALALVTTIVRDAAGLIDHETAAFLLQWLNGVLDPLDTARADAHPGAADPPHPATSPS